MWLLSHTAVIARIIDPEFLTSFWTMTFEYFARAIYLNMQLFSLLYILNTFEYYGNK